MTKKFPCWMRFRYYEYVGGPKRLYYGCMNNWLMALEAIHRLKIKEHLVSEFQVNDNNLSKEDIKKVFLSYEKHRREIEEQDEKREEALKEAGRASKRKLKK